MYYSSIGALAVIILLTINYDVFNKTRHSQSIRSFHLYRKFLFSVLFYYIADTFWGVIYDQKIPLLSYADTVLYFFTMAYSVFSWIRYVISYVNDENFFFMILKYFGIIFLCAESLMLIVNFFYPIMFWFSSDGLYHPEISRHIFIFVQIVFFTIISFYMFIETFKTHGNIKRRHRAIWLSGIIMTVFIAMQRLYVFIPFYSMGFMIATCIIHTFVLEDEKENHKEELNRLFEVEGIQEKELLSARLMAYTDPLTGVKSKCAYLEDILGIEKRIEDKILKDFGIVIFDVNDLKLTNDTKGHEEGDKLIKSACKIINQYFTDTPVYRIGGDEFVVFLMGENYKKSSDFISNFNRKIDENRSAKKVVIASGFAGFEEITEKSYKTLFELADSRMYERKKELKGK
ncbi:GGDEF domain-containing protein [Treponema sp.]|uniref:GGDEF domain-containing protein n=1 Tax=Treponema sp. TaxID=166 RepID=UPI00388F8664